MSRNSYACRPRATRLELTVLEGRAVPSGSQIYAVAANDTGGPRVQVYDNGGHKIADFDAFAPTFLGGVRIAVGDVNHDGLDDVVVAAGPGGGPHVEVFAGTGRPGAETGIDTAHPLASFFAFDPGFTGGVYVSAGDIDNDGFEDVVASAGAGGGPHVKVYEASADHATFTGLDDGHLLASYFAYDPGFRGGVRTAAADGTLVTAAGPGGGPHVKVYDTLDAAGHFVGLDPHGPADEFFAYNATFTGGVFVAVGDTDHDGKDDVITGAGAGGGPHVEVFHNHGTQHQGQFSADDLSASFMAGAATFTGGARVGVLRGADFDRVVVAGGHRGGGLDDAPEIADDHGLEHRAGEDEAETEDQFENHDQFEAFDLHGGGVVEDATHSGSLDDQFHGGLFVGN